MPSFRCKILTQDGQVLEKTLIAENESDLKQNAEREGNFVVECQKIDKSFADFFQSGGRTRFKEKDFFAFNQEFSVLVKAGLPFISALDTIIEGDEKSSLSIVLKEIREQVSAGDSLSQSFEHTSLFPPLYIASLQAGEKSGNIPLAISRYIEYMKKSSEIKQKVVSASVYPLILTLVSSMVLLFLLIYVVPAFAGTFAETGTSLPAMTTLLLMISNTLRNYFIYIAFVVAVITASFFHLKKTNIGRGYLDRFKLITPLVGDIYLNYSVAKFSRTLATVLGGGIPLLEALHISLGVLNNQFVRGKLENVIKRFQETGEFSASLSRAKIFPRVAVRLIDAGESSGALEDVLNEVAEFYENDVEQNLSLLTSAIEPVLMIIMGLLIGFIVLDMYLPIFQLAGAVS